MNLPVTGLFDLIKSLSRTEKRYFKQYSKIHVIGKENNYLLLFDEIEKQTKSRPGEDPSSGGYDEEQLLSIYKGHDVKRRFAVAKNYLHRQILKALRSYHGNNSIHKQVRNLLTDAEILFDKGLFTQSHKAIIKGKHLARGHELHYAMLEIFRFSEMNLAVKNADASWIQKILREETDELALLQNTKIYRSIYFRIGVEHYLHGTTRNKKHLAAIKKMMRSPLLLDEHQAKTFEAKLRFHDAHSFYFRIINDRRGLYLSVKSIIAHFKKHPEKIGHAVSAFMVYLNNMLDACTMNKKYDEIPIYLKELESLVPLAKSSQEKIKLFHISAINRLNYYTVTGQFSSAVSSLAKINKQLHEYEPFMNDFEKATLFQTIAISYFGAAQYKSCIRWLNRIRNEVSLNVRPDFESFLRLFYLITHYEAGNVDLLPSLIHSVYRTLRRKKQLYKFETVIIHFFRNELPKINSEKELIQAFQKLKNKIVSLVKDPYEKNVFDFFDYVSWLDSKIENRAFAEVVRSRQRTDSDSSEEKAWQYV